MVWMNLFASFDNRVRHCLFLGFIILFVFILYPAKKGTQKVNHIPWYDIVLAVVGAACYFNYVINLKSIVAMMTRIGTTEVVLGIIGILILAECCRRVVGIPILCVATAFVLYAYLPMFAGKTVALYKDDKKGEPELTSLKVKENGKVQLEIRPQGGILCIK